MTSQKQTKTRQEKEQYKLRILQLPFQPFDRRQTRLLSQFLFEASRIPPALYIKSVSMSLSYLIDTPFAVWQPKYTE